MGEAFLFSLLSCLTVCDPEHWSIPAFPVLHHLPEFLKLKTLCMTWNHETARKKQGEIFGIVIDCNFLDMTPQAQGTEAKVNKWDYTQVSIESLMLSNHIILCRPLLLLPSIFSSIRVFSNELTLCIWWSKLQHRSFQLTFRVDFL